MTKTVFKVGNRVGNMRIWNKQGLRIKSKPLILFGSPGRTIVRTFVQPYF
jgi:hypothetical protein